MDQQGPDRVAPSLLRSLAIYGGASGVWSDASRTRGIGQAGESIAGSRWPNKLLDAAQERWRRFNGHELVADARRRDVQGRHPRHGRPDHDDKREGRRLISVRCHPTTLDNCSPWFVDAAQDVADPTRPLASQRVASGPGKGDVAALCRLPTPSVFGANRQHTNVIAASARVDGAQDRSRREVFRNILDRLLHHATVLQIDGDSYRMRNHRARLQTLKAGLNHPAQGGEFSRSTWGILTIVDSRRRAGRPGRAGGVSCPAACSRRSTKACTSTSDCTATRDLALVVARRVPACPAPER